MTDAQYRKIIKKHWPILTKESINRIIFGFHWENLRNSKGKYIPLPPNEKEVVNRIQRSEVQYELEQKQLGLHNGLNWAEAYNDMVSECIAEGRGS